MNKLTDKQLNALSQVTGVEQETIKKQMQENVMKDCFDIDDLVEKKLKYYADTGNWTGFKELIVNLLCVTLNYVPLEYHIIFVNMAFQKMKHSTEKLKTVMKILKNK